MVDEKGDNFEFLHFTSLTREAFANLVDIVKNSIYSNSIVPYRGKLKKYIILRRRFNARDIVAMTVKYLLSRAELKDIHVHFGAILTTYINCVKLGMRCIVQTLSCHPKAKVFWDRSADGLIKAAERTKMFLDIPGVVAMMDGDKLRSKTPLGTDDQNRDYNGWTKDVNRNLLLVWDPFGKIVDAVVNAPGSFHDSKVAKWGNVYEHVSSLPNGYKCCCDDAFSTSGILSNKLVKTKEQYKGGVSRPTYDMSLTHLRQCSEWGNNILTGVFRRLRSLLPTDNMTRALIMWSCIYLHNYRTEIIGRNQIRKYFGNLVDEKV